MAASISVTAASVVRALGQTTASGTAGETVTAGCPVYLKASDSRLWLADADASSEASTVIGISMHAATAGQPLTYLISGPLTLGSAVMTAGVTHYLQISAGLIAGGPPATAYQSVLGIASTTSILYVNIWNSGYQLA